MVQFFLLFFSIWLSPTSDTEHNTVSAFSSGHAYSPHARNFVGIYNLQPRRAELDLWMQRGRGREKEREREREREKEPKNRKYGGVPTDLVADGGCLGNSEEAQIRFPRQRLRLHVLGTILRPVGYVSRTGDDCFCPFGSWNTVACSDHID